MDYGQVKPAFTADKSPVKSFGPFENTRAGDEGPIGAHVYIRIYP